MVKMNHFRILSNNNWVKQQTLKQGCVVLSLHHIQITVDSIERYRRNLIHSSKKEKGYILERVNLKEELGNERSISLI
jgi:hypothetical protein